VLVVGVVVLKQHARHVFPSSTKGPLKFPGGGTDGFQLSKRESLLSLLADYARLSF
jgi:hypothetical protein